MKKWLISELFYPIETSTGYFMTKIAEKLSINHSSGINVITGPDSYDSTKPTLSKLKGKVDIHRITIPKFNKNKLIQRTVRMLLLAFRMSYRLYKNSKKADKVFIVTNPAPLLVLVSLVKKIVGFNLIIIVHDVFPENMVPAGIIERGSLLFKLLSYIFNWAYRQADKIISVGEDMNELLIRKARIEPVKTEVIRNWADCEEIYPLNLTRKQVVDYYGIKDIQGKVVIQFAGNIGRLQGLPGFLQAFKLANNSELALIIMGEGAVKGELIAIVAESGIDNVYFLPAMPRDEQCRFLNASDIGLVSLNKGMFGLGVPSKTYNIWAAGKPVLFIGDKKSEIARNIENHNSGWAFNWEDQDSLVAFLAALRYDNASNIFKKGEDSRTSALKYFEREVILNEYNKY